MTQSASNLATIMDSQLEKNGFERIEEPEKFKQDYRNQIEREENSFDASPDNLISYGVFNVDEICEPYVESNTLVFYAKKKIPYKITCSLPLNSETSEIKYTLLQLEK